MSRDKNKIRHTISRPRKSKRQPSSCRAATARPIRTPASMTETTFQQSVMRATVGGASAIHTVGELLGSLLDLVAEFDATGVLLDVWTADKSLLVRPVHEMLGKDLRSIVGDEACRPFRELFARIHSSGIAEDIEYGLNLADGLHWFLARAIPVDSLDGAARTIRILAQDVTAWKKGEEQSQKIHELLAHTQEIANVGSWEYDTENKTLLGSDNMYRMLGLTPDAEPVPLEKACKMFHSDDRARVKQDVQTLIKTGQMLENEARLQTACGEIRTFFSRAIPITDEQGKVRLIRGISQDITEQRAAEIKLRESQELLAQAEEIAHLGSWKLDPQGQTRMLSENLYRIMGEDPKRGPISVEEALQKMDTGDAELVRTNLNSAMKQAVSFEQEIHYRRPDGQVRTFFISGVPVLDASGNLTHLVGVTRDLTEEREVQRARREAEEDYRLLLNSLKDYAVLTLDRNGYVTNWHEGAGRVKGYMAKEILGMHFSRFYPAEDIASEKPVRELNQAMREGIFEGEGWRVRSDGSRFWADVLITPLRDDHGVLKGFASITHDITERRISEEELAKREALLAEAETLANMGSWELDLRTGEMNWSLELYRILGLDPVHTAPSFAAFSQLIHIDVHDQTKPERPLIATARFPIEAEVRWGLGGETSGSSIRVRGRRTTNRESRSA
jgi:PAS domain S-box-containing protein